MTAHRAATAQPNETVVSLRDVSKSFGSVDALKGVSLDIRSGEVHILLGENGAGKSTLVNVILGAITPDSGVLEINGRRTTHQTPAQAREQGINAVLQDFSLAPSLKVYENLFLGREITQKGLLRKAEMRRQAIETLHSLASPSMSICRSRASAGPSNRSSKSSARSAANQGHCCSMSRRRR